MSTVDHCMEEALKRHETNDCGVRALACVCSIPYPAAHMTFRILGRRPRDGVHMGDMFKALKKHAKNVGNIQLIQQPNGSRFTPISVAKAYPKGRFLLYSRGHVMAMVDGEILDWAQNRRLRIVAIQEVKI